MKLPNPEFRSPNPETARFPVSGFRLHPSRRGMALVITLILLSVTLVMAIAFLAISRRERVSVTTANEVTTARLAADAALDAAQAQIIANIGVSESALHNYHLLVSTNYINGMGFNSSVTTPNPTNVNYDYYITGAGPVSGADFVQNVANLQFLPRAPVMVDATAADTNGGRFYLDLNRNNLFEDTSPTVSAIEVNASGNGFTNGVISQVGDPQWVGILQYPGGLHSADNRFLSRYAYIALPVGESLDINAIHNQVWNTSLGASDGYLRNQGVGSWEINLAAFFADLNTNQWNSPTILNAVNNPYIYRQWLPTPFANLGSAFEDARAILSWRYGNSYLNLATANFVFGPANFFPLDNIDEYGDGPLQTQAQNINESLLQDPVAFSWAGANNPNRFYTLADFYDPTKSSGGAFGGFTNRLLNAGNTVTANGLRTTYDRYTLYRMLDQLATDSEPDTARMNLNFRNLTNGVIVPGLETNQFAWTPLEFFTNAADRLLKIYTTNWLANNFVGYTNTFGTSTTTPIGVSRIPVYVNGKMVYSSALHRLLQLSANIYDATSPDFYPSVFKPVFSRSGNDIYITGFVHVVTAAGVGDPVFGQPFTPEEFSQVGGVGVPVNIYGVPWIIGAKKNLPNFNQLYSFTTLEATRKLQFIRQPSAVGKDYSAATANLYTTNQMIAAGITNAVGFAFWNSYSNAYPNGAQNYPFATPNITIYARNFSQAMLSNGFANAFVNNTYQYQTNITVWPGSQWSSSTQPDAREPMENSFFSAANDFTVLPTDSLLFNAAGNFAGYGPQVFNLSVTVVPTFPHIVLYATNLFQAFILDNGRVIDYVQFRADPGPKDLAVQLRDQDYLNGTTYYMWSTNLDNKGLNWGVHNQITVSKTGTAHQPPGGKWAKTPYVTPDMEAGYFAGFFQRNWTYSGVTRTNTELTNQAPFTPIRSTTAPIVWSVNDPLVHYMASDLAENLNGSLNANGVAVYDDPDRPTIPTPSLNKVTDRYQPWGRKAVNNSLTGSLNNQEESKYNLAFKDPLVWGSDNWDFPTNRLPSAGWLGRVHRGTPWQSVYLKATNLLEYVDMAQANTNVGYITWTNWTGNGNAYDADNARPTRDNLLFDVFTASPHPNATRGTLSVNQTHLASWSAVLSGMMVLTNQTDAPNFDIVPVITNTVVEPAGLDSLNSPLGQIVNGPDGINATRANTNIFANGAFTRIGDILRVPALTEKSPFINRADSAKTEDRLRYEISDEQYEWLPQQVLGLLRVSSAPRYVVYAWGQTLKPAPGGTVLGNQFFGLVTNYQVVAETATRAVITVLPTIKNTGSGMVTNYTTRVESFNVLPPE